MTKSMDWFYPGDGWNGERQDRPEKTQLKRSKIEPGQKSAERQQHQQDQTGGRRRQQLLNASQQHDVHGNEDGNPVNRLGPDQPNARLPVVDLAPFGENAATPPVVRASNSQ